MYQENAQELYTHNREVAVYRHLFPILQEKCGKICLEDNQVALSVPTSYYLWLEDGPNGKTTSSTLIMEDLKCQGFRQQQPTEAFDYQHSKVALTALAQYHALSITYLRSIQSPDGHFNLPHQLRFVAGVNEFDLLIDDSLHNDMPYIMEYFKSNGFQKVRFVSHALSWQKSFH